MTPERWLQIKELFHEALVCEPAQREEFLVVKCAGDAPLRTEVESLLSSLEEDEGFIEAPVGDLAAELLGTHRPTYEPGQQIQNYRIERQIGSGGMGEVYLAEDTKLNRNVALKLLPPHFTVNPDRVRRFKREARAASALNHPNIVTIYEIGQSDSTHFIATEFVDGKTLRQLINEKPLTLNETLNVSMQVAEALNGAHVAGIVHRDIKPENIMIRQDGYVKILDFGLAKLAEPRHVGDEAELETPTLLQTNPGLVMGTVQYMSPEQARAKNVGVATDIWSLGIVMYELLAGHVPFTGETPSHVMVALMEDELPSLAAYANVPAKLNRIVAHALRKNQKERYKSAKELAQDLKNLKLELQTEPRWKGFLTTVPRDKPTETDAQGLDAVRASATSTFNVGITHLTTSAEHLTGQIKRHKTLTVAAVVVLLVGALVFGYWFFANRPAGKNEINSIAVIPFINETTNADAEYLSDGITETLIGNLSQLPELKVIARSSTFKYKGKDVDPREAGRSLGVEAILTGRILQRGGNFLISVELINARDATHIWSEQYNRKEPDLLAAQTEIAQEITGALRLRLTPFEQRQIAKRETVNPQAYELLLKGRFYGLKGGTENRKKAIEFFQQAIAVDPAYALAYAALSGSYRGLVNSNLADPKKFTPKAQDMARKALELDESLAEAHLAMANVKSDAWEWAAAEREYKRAMELNPNLSEAQIGYTFFLIIQGRNAEVLASARRARELDPLSTGANAVVVYGLLLAGQNDQAIEAAKRMLELDPNIPFVHSLLGQVHTRRGEYLEALAAWQEAIRLGDDSPDAQTFLGAAYAKTGQPEKTRAILKRLENGKDYVSPVGLAKLYAALGDLEQTFALLERAYDAHDQQLIWLGVEPAFSTMPSDPRYGDLLRRVGLK